MGSPHNKHIPWSLRAHGLSDIGQCRSKNEDRYLVALDSQLFIVSDGMGGRPSGEIAAQAVVTVLPTLLTHDPAWMATSTTNDREQIVRDAIVTLNRQLRTESRGRLDLRGLGATLVVLWIHDAQAHLAHLGDSRIYLFRQDQLQLLTEDHSITALLLRQGEISTEQAHTHPSRGQITRYIGMEGEIMPTIQTIPLIQGDRLLLCTDGLTTMVTDQQIAHIFRTVPDPKLTCQTLIQAANKAGGHDNITALVIDCAPGTNSP